MDRPYIPLHIRRQVEEDAKNRCGYCLTPRLFTAKILHVEHIIPLAAGGTSQIEIYGLPAIYVIPAKGFELTHSIR